MNYVLNTHPGIKSDRISISQTHCIELYTKLRGLCSSQWVLQETHHIVFIVSFYLRANYLRHVSFSLVINRRLNMANSQMGDMRHD